MLCVAPRIMELWLLYVCPVIGTLCDFMGNKLPSYENFSKCLILDKKKLMNGSRVQCIHGTALPLYLYESNEKKINLKFFSEDDHDKIK